ncbi:SAUR-like auxin-responsive family protein [Medicago truncatula]|uniref:SAUR-like auxin-responsive family protein n=1 Tax=Medicago truncatula TaxID=3880 RepID=A0A072TPR6_MEDTR|nr:SAUR-like auxin-responsive family protein [Medicago truncatula]
MGFRLPAAIRRASFSSSQTSKVLNVPKGYLAVQDEEELGYDHPMGGLTIPCTEDVFLHITSHFNGL